MASPTLAIQYARSMAECLQGHPLYDLEPHDTHCDAFLIEGTQLFDVAWLNSRGELNYSFSTGLGPNDARNQDNSTHGSLLPPGHEKYTGCRPGLDFTYADKNGQCYASQTIDAAQVSGNISVPIAPGVAPASVSAALSFSVSDEAGAVLYIPDKHTVWQDTRINLSSNYARTHTAEWYRFLNGDNHRAIRNGELYFVTSCTKAKEWHNLCACSSSHARSISVQFHPVPQAAVGFTGSFVSSSSVIQPRSGPVTGPPQRATQCASVVPVLVDKASESTFWSKFFGKSEWVPYGSNQNSISNGNPPASGGNNESSTTRSQATDIKETPSTSTASKQVKFERDKIVTRAGDRCWIDTGKQLGIDGEAPTTHALTEVFPYIEESAPWMDVVIAHDLHYLSVLAKGEYVPDAKELATRLMRHFVIDVDEDMNGMLVNREECHLTKDDLAFVVHDARRYTDKTLGFDVIRKNIPAGWTLAPPRFGLGIQLPVSSTPVAVAAVSHGPCTVFESSKPDKSLFLSMIDEQDDEDDDFPLPPPPYTPFSGDSPYAELEAGLASLQCLNDLKGAKTIQSDPRWDQYFKDDYVSVRKADGMGNPKLPPRKLLILLAIARRAFIQGEPFPEDMEVMALAAVKKLFAVLENSGRPRFVKFAKTAKRGLAELGYYL